jgi:hypothetical protein
LRAASRRGLLGAAGHSYGAWTVQHLLGQGITMPRWNVPDRRLRAGIALSPVPPRRGIAVPVPRMVAPLLHMTGTADSSPLDDVTWEQRTPGRMRRAARGRRGD